MDNKNEYIEFSGTAIKIPDIALGKNAPAVVHRIIAAEERAEKAERKSRLYFWGGIIATVLCTILGYLLGKFC